MRIKLEFEELLNTQRVWFSITEQRKHDSIKNLEKFITRVFHLEGICPNGIILELDEFRLFPDSEVGDLIREDNLIRQKVLSEKNIRPSLQVFQNKSNINKRDESRKIEIDKCDESRKSETNKYDESRKSDTDKHDELRKTDKLLWESSTKKRKNNGSINNHIDSSSESDLSTGNTKKFKTNIIDYPNGDQIIREVNGKSKGVGIVHNYHNFNSSSLSNNENSQDTLTSIETSINSSSMNEIGVNQLEKESSDEMETSDSEDSENNGDSNDSSNDISIDQLSGLTDKIHHSMDIADKWIHKSNGIINSSIISESKSTESQQDQQGQQELTPKKSTQARNQRKKNALKKREEMNKKMLSLSNEISKTNSLNSENSILKDQSYSNSFHIDENQGNTSNISIGKAFTETNVIQDTIVTSNSNDNSQKSNDSSLSKSSIKLKPPMSLSTTSNKKKGYFQDMKNRTPIHYRFTGAEEIQEGKENSGTSQNIVVDSEETPSIKSTNNKNDDEYDDTNLGIIDGHETQQLPLPRAIITRVDISSQKQNSQLQNNGNNVQPNLGENNVNNRNTKNNNIVQTTQEQDIKKVEFEKMELYQGRPNINDVIAYKVLEFSQLTCTPELSSYEIVGYDPIANKVTLVRCKKLDKQTVTSRNKFQLEGLDDEFILDDQESRIGVFTIGWDELHQVRKVVRNEK
ncbi:9920_t:CDS:2 [Diversispora eburnea]|uniref:9920_t:CDS:1 n=1 Tax=Diversispora eburnea TaxID=1213867 RepID=A0A9N8W0D1_9GLOM|nr:9920_t:CDS:2 [Diversispora eburnea]